jgi:hypothetical protein
MLLDLRFPGAGWAACRLKLAIFRRPDMGEEFWVEGVEGLLGNLMIQEAAEVRRVGRSGEASRSHHYGEAVGRLES